MKLLRLPGTYPPQADTWLLADVLRRSGLADGRRVLDVGTGTGALALAASAGGAHSVTAVDLSARSLASAWVNTRRSGARVRLLRGDLLGPVRGERFDLVVANPPYVPAAGDVLPRHRSARCWDAGVDGRALLDRFCAEAPRLLAPGGALLLVHSTVADPGRTQEHLTAGGLRVTEVARVAVPLGPVMRARAGMLAERGLLAAGQETEEVVVIAGHAPALAGSSDAGTPDADLAATA